MKTIRLEVSKILSGDKHEREGVWKALAEEALIATNMFWHTWESWHRANGTDVAVRQSLELYKTWLANDKQGAKPKWPVAMPKPLSDLLYSTLHHPDPNDRVLRTHSRSVEMLRHSLGKKVSKCKSAKGSLPGWCSILLYRQGRPSSINSQPVIIPNNYCTIIAPATKKDNWRIQFTVERQRVKRGDSKDEVEIWTRGSKYGSVSATLAKIAAGTAKHHGGSLVFDKRKRKWFVLLQWSSTVTAVSPQLDVGTFAFLRPARHRPWSLKINARTLWTVFGFGSSVASIRRQVITNRWSRQNNYRVAGSSNKGHGRFRALHPIDKLSTKWKEFTKRTNHSVTSDVVRQCVANGVGSLVYFQPSDNSERSRFLFVSGKLEKSESSGWDWSQVAAMLAYKCNEVGIKLIVRKSKDREKAVLEKRKGA